MQAHYKHLAEDVNLGTLKSCEAAHAEDNLDMSIKGKKNFTDIVKSLNGSRSAGAASKEECATFQLLNDMVNKISAAKAISMYELGIDPKCITIDKEAGTARIVPYPIVVSDIEDGEDNG